MSGCGELFYSDGEITYMLECYVFFTTHEYIIHDGIYVQADGEYNYNREICCVML